MIYHTYYLVGLGGDEYEVVRIPCLACFKDVLYQDSCVGALLCDVQKLVFKTHVISSSSSWAVSMLTTCRTAIRGVWRTFDVAKRWTWSKDFQGASYVTSSLTLKLNPRQLWRRTSVAWGSRYWSPYGLELGMEDLKEAGRSAYYR